MSCEIAIDRVRGDALGLAIPAHGAALEAAGADWLTEAFRATGALAPDNAVAAIRELRECPGGSTGRKFFLTVDYQRPEPALQRELFVKFSRDFDDAMRDLGKDQMEPEVRLALVSRDPGFPIAVPACYFADYHRASGTGVLITQRIRFGEGGLEPLHHKCLDYTIDDAPGHYRALVRALARLAGTHRAGGLPPSVERELPFERQRQIEKVLIRFGREKLERRLQRLNRFAESNPGLLPAPLRANAFLDRLARELPRFLERQQAIAERLHDQPRYIALTHWNANIDNGWYWRDESGELQCGLLDWGGVTQMNVGLALWGALSGAETTLWERHLDEMVALFAEEYRSAGGPALEPRALRLQMLMFASMLCINWLLDAPAIIAAQLPELAGIRDRFDPRFAGCEGARSVLQMLTNVLWAWHTHGPAELLGEHLGA